jgi:hypothetical protein
VRRDVVVLIEEGIEADLDIVQRRDGSEVVQAALAKGAPEALHLASRRRITRPGVDERDPQPLAAKTEDFAAIGRAIVEVERVRRTVTAQRADEQGEHVGFLLGVVRLERDDEARGVVEQGVDAQGARLTADEDRLTVTDVAVPERARTVGLPAQPGLLPDPVAQADPVQPFLGEEPP